MYPFLKVEESTCHSKYCCQWRLLYLGAQRTININDWNVRACLSNRSKKINARCFPSSLCGCPFPKYHHRYIFGLQQGRFRQVLSWNPIFPRKYEYLISCSFTVGSFVFECVWNYSKHWSVTVGAYDYTTLDDIV